MKIRDAYSKEESRSLKVGMSVALFLLLSIAYFTVQKSAVKMENDKGDLIIQAKFGRSNGLVVGDKVMLSGLVIGKVTNAILDKNYDSILTLSIDGNVRIPTDSSASIVSSSILGSKYISVEPGGEETYLRSGDSFEYTQDAMVINELLERIVAIGKKNCGQQSCTN